MTTAARKYIRTGRSCQPGTAVAAPEGAAARPKAVRNVPLERARWYSLRDERRRRLNVALAVVGLLMTLPMLLLISIAVKCASRGPVFYTQSRVGLNRRRRGRPQRMGCRRQYDRGGRLFTILKFRTMNTQSGAAEIWACPRDPRVTRIGAQLRKYRLDELPQFVNVIRGDMNIVGPRPEQPAIFLRLRAEIDGYARRQHVLPGITGWAQINQRYDRCLDDVRRKTALDLEYLGRRCVVEDIRIMGRTLPVMLGRIRRAAN